MSLIEVPVSFGELLDKISILEIKSERMSDPAKYRTREDVDNVKETRDPIARLQKHLMTEFGMKESEFDAVDSEIKAEIAKVAEAATTAPRPGASELFTDVVPE